MAFLTFLFKYMVEHIAEVNVWVKKKTKLVTILSSSSLIVQVFTVHLSFLLCELGIFYFMLNSDLDYKV